MNLKKISSFLCFLPLLLFSGAGQAATDVGDTYRIDMTVSLNGSLIGKPALIAEAGAQAEIRDENPMKPNHGFRILVTVTPLDTGHGSEQTLKLDLEFYGRHQGKWIERAKNSVTMISGNSVNFSFPSKPPEEDGETYDLVLSVGKNYGASAPAK